MATMASCDGRERHRDERDLDGADPSLIALERGVDRTGGVVAVPAVPVMMMMAVAGHVTPS
jgi:hypothetical protein